jgi:hypothetical protein
LKKSRSIQGHLYHLAGGGGGSLDPNIFGPSLYLGLVFTSCCIISPNSSAHRHQSILASCAPNAFLDITYTNGARVYYTQHSSGLDDPPDTWRVKGSQCSQLYLWTAHIPRIGTKTRSNPMTPRHHGVFITALTNN